MKLALPVTLLCCALAGFALSQERAATADSSSPIADIPPQQTGTLGANVPSSTPANPPSTENTVTTAGETDGAREMPLDAETFDVRVRRRVDEYRQRHQQRESQMASYVKAADSDPGVTRFADPRKVQVELSDEQDREQTSEELASDYASQARNVQSKLDALQDFIAKRRQIISDLGKQNGAASRQDLEIALTNLARQPESPETMAEMREIDHRLSEGERNEKEFPVQIADAQQAVTGASEELGKLRVMQQSYEKESKAYTADALAARHNQLRLASRLEYYLVRAQAEDELDQGNKALQSAQHLAASAQVERTLNNSGPGVKSDEALERLKDCLRQSGDVKSCREKQESGASQ